MEKTFMPDKLLTKQEASAYLAVSRRTVDRFRQKGLLPAVKVGHVVRFALADLDDFLRRHRR